MDKVELVMMAKCDLDGFDRYRRPPERKGYRVEFVVGAACPWRVLFLVDDELAGGGQYRTAEQAEDAGVDFMFSGWGGE